MLLCPRTGGIKWWCCLMSVLTSDVCRIHPVGGRCVRPAGWIACIGWSGPARLGWLKAAPACFRCSPGWGHIVVAAHLQLVCIIVVSRLRIHIIYRATFDCQSKVKLKFYDLLYIFNSMMWTCLFSYCSQFDPPLLSEHVRRRSNGPVLRAEVLQGIVSEHIHSIGLWAGNDGDTSQQTSLH